MKIAVIGAGPVGCYSAHLLALKGHSVTVYENHATVGSPIQCTGLLTADFDELGFSVDSFLVNTFSRVDVFSPTKRASFAQKEYLVSREKFDQFFANLAIKEGVEIKVNHCFLRREGEELIIKDTKVGEEVRVTADIVIAADGPLSPTAKAYGLYNTKRENYCGLQATVAGEFDMNAFEAYFGRSVCPELFAWVVPESSTRARVGLAMRKNSRAYFDTFMNDRGFEIIEMQAGTIPIYHPAQKLVKDNCYLVGDAAGFVKATTLGGLVPGLHQAKILADCIESGRSYSKASKKLARRLRLHRVIRRMLDKFSDKDWDKLVFYMSQRRVKSVVEKYTRDNPIPLVAKALLYEPRLLLFGRKLI